jgi:ATP-dependent DNA helicase RecG
MNLENQNTEWKENWRDEYLKWICGFANTEGGKLFIGIDDKGEVCGIDNALKLMDEIPNKVRNLLGLVVDVALRNKNGKDYLEITTDAYPFPVNYKGQYHYRSGSTKQELHGAALDKFLLQKRGKRWDSVLVFEVNILHLDDKTFDFFRKRAVKSNRIEENVLTENNEQILDNLQLVENKIIKMAAVLLFHPNPEKFVTGAFIKIGFFKTDSELIFQDEIHGNLFSQVETTIDLLFTKYIKAIISYEGIQRIETYEYPKEAVREALLNAIAHKDYSCGIPIQISVYDDKLMIWNEGILPENWTIENLIRKHASKPYNPDISNAFFRCGYIELWGRGTIKIVEMCQAHGLPSPLYCYEGHDFWVTFRKNYYNQENLQQLGLNQRQIEAILYVWSKGEITNKEYQKLVEVSKATATRELKELTEKFKLLIRSGIIGAGTKYKLIGS